MDIKVVKTKTLHIILVLALSFTILIPATGCDSSMGCYCSNQEQARIGNIILLVVFVYSNSDIDRNAPAASADPEKLKPIKTPTGCVKKNTTNQDAGGTGDGAAPGDGC